MSTELSNAAAIMGRKGGKSTSEAKRKAVRENGKKRGRKDGTSGTSTLTAGTSSE